MEASEGLLAILAELDAANELSEEDEVEDDGGGQQGVLARVVDGQRVAAAHEDLRDILVHGPLGVGDGWHVLDDDHVVWVLTCRGHAVTVRPACKHLTYNTKMIPIIVFNILNEL